MSYPQTEEIVCCSVLQCVAVCCSVLQYVAVCCSPRRRRSCAAECCSVLRCVAVCCSMLQCVAVPDGGDRNYDNQNIQQVFMGAPIHIKHIFTGVPKILHDFSVESTESPSLKWRVIPRTWMSHVTCMNLSWHAHMTETCHTYEWVMSHIWVSHIASIYIDNSMYVWPHRFVTWLIRMRSMTWRIHMCDMTHPYVWHDLFMCVTWLIYMSDMTHSFVWHDSFICVTWLIHTCDMTHSYMRSMTPSYARHGSKL